MSEFGFNVYFEYAERRGKEDEVFNGYPKVGVVYLFYFQFSVFNS